MTKYITCEEMKKLEKKADDLGLSYYDMMENAGTEVFNCIVKKTRGDISGKKVVVFCGKGNNGGDGFVVARLLSNEGAFVTLVLVEGPPVTHDAVKNYKLLSDCYVQIVDIHDVSQIGNSEIDIVVDAIYGTGFKGVFNKEALVSVYLMNKMRETAKVFSIDIPSGLEGDLFTGTTLKNTPVKADFTITFHMKKPIHFCLEASPFLGEIITVDIGIKNVL